MAFTQAELQAEIDADGLNCKITQFNATSSASYTDVYVQNMNSTADKSGWVQVAQSNTAAEAATAIRAALT